MVCGLSYRREAKVGLSDHNVHDSRKAGEASTNEDGEEMPSH